MCVCKYTQMHMKCDSVSRSFSGALPEILPCCLTGSVGSHDVWWWVIVVIYSCVSCPPPICSPRNSLRDLKIASPCLMPLINIRFTNLTVQELQILVPTLVLKFIFILMKCESIIHGLSRCLISVHVCVQVHTDAHEM